MNAIVVGYEFQSALKDINFAIMLILCNLHISTISIMTLRDKFITKFIKKMYAGFFVAG